MHRPVVRGECVRSWVAIPHFHYVHTLFSFMFQIAGFGGGGGGPGPCFGMYWLALLTSELGGTEMDMQKKNSDWKTFLG